jgi:hypothetical protein
VRLSGVEHVSVEVGVSLGAAATLAMEARVPSPLVLARGGSGHAHASLLVLEMRGLGLGRLPPRFGYREVLYRLGVTIDGAPAWLALRCDIDRPLVATMARSLIRYPVRSATIAIDEPSGATLSLGARTSSDDLAMTLSLVPGRGTPEAIPPRRTFVVDGGALFEVPWDERPAPERHDADVVACSGSALEAAFGGPTTFEPRALVHRGRGHFCGPARRVRTEGRGGDAT